MGRSDDLGNRLGLGVGRSCRRHRYFADRASGKSAKERFVTPEEVIDRAPDVIVGSWCGKKFRPDKVAKRPGFDALLAVQRNALVEIKSPLILQPGPAALTDGLAALEAIVAQTAANRVNESLL